MYRVKFSIYFGRDDEMNCYGYTYVSEREMATIYNNLVYRFPFPGLEVEVTGGMMMFGDFPSLMECMEFHKIESWETYDYNADTWWATDLVETILYLPERENEE